MSDGNHGGDDGERLSITVAIPCGGVTPVLAHLDEQGVRVTVCFTPCAQVAKSAVAVLFETLEETLGDIYEMVENLPQPDQREVEPVTMALSKTLHAAQMDAARAIGVKVS